MSVFECDCFCASQRTSHISVPYLRYHAEIKVTVLGSLIEFLDQWEEGEEKKTKTQKANLYKTGMFQPPGPGLLWKCLMFCWIYIQRQHHSDGAAPGAPGAPGVPG